MSVSKLVCSIINFLFFATYITYSQQKVTYIFKYLGEDQVAELYYNGATSFFIYSKYGLDNSYNSKAGLLMENGKMVLKSSSYDSVGNIIYRNFIDSTLLIREVDNSPMVAYTVSDKWLPIDWKIDGKTKLISGLKCRKAFGSFRGRDYIAWFADDIKVAYGPWKLFGLPGLIIEAYDIEKIFYAKFVSISDKLDSNQTELNLSVSSNHKSIEEYVYYRDNYFIIMIDSLKARIPSNLDIRIGDVQVDGSIEKRRENYFERIYEWEIKDKQRIKKIDKQLR